MSAVEAKSRGTLRDAYENRPSMLRCILLLFPWGVGMVKAHASHQCDPGFDSLIVRHVWAEIELVLDLAPRVFLLVLQLSSLGKNQHAADSSWLNAVL